MLLLLSYVVTVFGIVAWDRRYLQEYDEIGKLIHDFGCSDASQMLLPLLAERARYLKETLKGVIEMTHLFDRLRDEGRKEGRQEEKLEMTRNLLSLGLLSLEQIAKVTGLSQDQIKLIQTQTTA